MSKNLNKHNNFNLNANFFIQFKSIICPENEKDYYYISKFYKTKEISNDEKKKELLKQEE